MLIFNKSTADIKKLINFITTVHKLSKLEVERKKDMVEKGVEN